MDFFTASCLKEILNILLYKNYKFLSVLWTFDAAMRAETVVSFGVQGRDISVTGENRRDVALTT